MYAAHSTDSVLTSPPGLPHGRFAADQNRCDGGFRGIAIYPLQERHPSPVGARQIPVRALPSTGAAVLFVLFLELSSDAARRRRQVDEICFKPFIKTAPLLVLRIA